MIEERSFGSLKMTIGCKACREGAGIKIRVTERLRVGVSVDTLFAPQSRGGVDASGATAGDGTRDQRHHQQH